MATSDPKKAREQKNEQASFDDALRKLLNTPPQPKEKSPKKQTGKKPEK